MPGITGVMKDGILPGFFGYEAGQAAVGDMFAWFGGRLLGLGSGEPAGRPAGTRSSNARRASIAPGASGLVALDWWNGNRSILARRRPVGSDRRPHARDDAGRGLPGTSRVGRLRHTADRRELRRARRRHRRDSRLWWHRRAQLAHDAAARGRDRARCHHPGLEPDPRPRRRSFAERSRQAHRGAASTISRPRSARSGPGDVASLRARRPSTMRPTTRSTRSSRPCTTLLAGTTSTGCTA